MRKMLFAAALVACAAGAHAQTMTFLGISTATYSGVAVSTSAPTRVDALNLGAVYDLPNRVKIRITVPNASGRVNCGYSNAVSTQAASGYFGREMEPGSTVDIELGYYMAYWCLAQSVTASQPISVEQISPFRPGSHTIPGLP